VPLPRAHVEKLEEELVAHEQRLAVLTERIERLSQEAAAHQLIIELGRNRELINALDEVHGERKLCRELSVDPGAFFRKRGIDLSAQGDLAAQEHDGLVAISLRSRRAGWDFSLMWDTADGFSLAQHAVPGAAADWSANADQPHEG
jgi:hypothetical protein